MTVKNGLCVLFDEADELIEQSRDDSRVDQDEAHEREVEWEGIPEFGFIPEVIGDPIGLNKNRNKETKHEECDSNLCHETTGRSVQSRAGRFATR